MSQETKNSPVTVLSTSLKHILYEGSEVQVQSAITDSEGNTISQTYLKTVPIASNTVLGGIKVGNNLTIAEDGTLSAPSSGASTWSEVQDKPFNSLSAEFIVDSDILSIASIPYSKITSTPTIPTKTSQLQNDSGFITTSALDGYYTKLEVDSSLNNKLDKITGTTDFAQAYIKTKAGAQGFMNISVNVDANTMPIRGENGVVNVGTPTQDTHATTKLYVDNAISGIEIPTVPTNVSEFTNDAGYITNSVNNLSNYYLKTETYTQSQVDELLSDINTDINGINTELDNKLDKVTSVTTYMQAYVKTAQGTQTNFDLRSDVAGNSLVLRDSIGAVNTAEPNSANNATTKNYVDNLISGINQDITSIQSDVTELENTTLKNSGNQTLSGTLTTTGNITVQGDLTVQGTTTTTDTETLAVQDNMIVTNSNGTTLSDLSGLFIKTDLTNGYAIVYDPSKSSVILGQGTLSDTNEVTVSDSERKAVVTRQDSDTFTDEHLVMWDTENNGIVDSGFSRSNIAATSAANTFTQLQTFNKGISVTGSIQFGSNNLTAPNGSGQIARIQDIPSTLPNPQALTFGSKTYNGSAAQTITASDIGALTSIPTATGSVLGGVKSSTTGTTSGRDYNVQVNTDGTMKVNVPWTDNNTVTNIGANGSGYTSGNINFVGSGATTVSKSGTTVTIASTNTTYSNATQSTSGLMSSADKIKLDGLQNVDTSSFVTTNTTQTINATKTFSSGINVASGINMTSGTFRSTGNIIPNGTNFYLGTAENKWAHSYINNVHIGGCTASYNSTDEALEFVFS